jgi:hypothetical protein
VEGDVALSSKKTEGVLEARGLGGTMLGPEREGGLPERSNFEGRTMRMSKI